MEVMLAGCFVEDSETAKKFYLETLGLNGRFPVSQIPDLLEDPITLKHTTASSSSIR